MHHNAERKNTVRYVPKTEEQLAEEALLQDGTYDFSVIETDDKPSKKGNDMITLKLCVFDGDGEQRHIFDYIAMGNPFGEKKLRRAANSCGLLETYNTGNLKDDDFLGVSGKLLLKQQSGTPDYPLPKNVVADYLPREDGYVPPTKPAREIIDDDIPF
jgi:hypothetical protein